MKKKNAVLLWTTYMILATSAGIVAAQLVTRRTNLALSAILAICVLYLIIFIYANTIDFIKKGVSVKHERRSKRRMVRRKA